MDKAARPGWSPRPRSGPTVLPAVHLRPEGFSRAGVYYLDAAGASQPPEVWSATASSLASQYVRAACTRAGRDTDTMPDRNYRSLWRFGPQQSQDSAASQPEPEAPFLTFLDTKQHTRLLPAARGASRVNELYWEQSKEQHSQLIQRCRESHRRKAKREGRLGPRLSSTGNVELVMALESSDSDSDDAEVEADLEECPVRRDERTLGIEDTESEDTASGSRPSSGLLIGIPARLHFSQLCRTRDLRAKHTPDELILPKPPAPRRRSSLDNQSRARQVRVRAEDGAQTTSVVGDVQLTLADDPKCKTSLKSAAEEVLRGVGKTAETHARDAVVLLQERVQQGAEQKMAAPMQGWLKDREAAPPPKEQLRSASQLGRREFVWSCEDQQVLPLAVLELSNDGSSSRTIESRSWANYNLGADLVTALTKAVDCGSTSAQIRKLNLSGNAIRGMPASELVRVIQTRCSGLQELDLSRNSIGEAAGHMLADMLMQNSCITKLNLSQNRLGDNVCSLLARGIKFSLSLTDLNLSHNNIATKCALVLGDSLENNVQLMKLDLSYNEIRMQGAVALSKAISMNAGLTWLDVPSSYQAIEDRHMPNIIRLLRSQPDGPLRLGFLRILAEERIFKTSQLPGILKCFDVQTKIKVVATLWASISDQEQILVQSKELLGNNGLQRLRDELGMSYYFNRHNATGHYKVKLDNEYDRIWARLVDEENLNLILDVVTPGQRASLFHRIG